MAIRYYGFLTTWFRTERVLRTTPVGLAASYPACQASMAEARRREVPPYAQYVLVNRQAGRTWQVVLAGWPRPRELSMGTQNCMAAICSATWPPYDPADPDPPYPFAILILQRSPERLHHFRITVFPRRIATCQSRTGFVDSSGCVTRWAICFITMVRHTAISCAIAPAMRHTRR